MIDEMREEGLCHQSIVTFAGGAGGRGRGAMTSQSLISHIEREDKKTKASTSQRLITHRHGPPLVIIE